MAIALKATFGISFGCSTTNGSNWSGEIIRELPCSLNQKRRTAELFEQYSPYE